LGIRENFIRDYREFSILCRVLEGSSEVIINMILETPLEEEIVHFHVDNLIIITVIKKESLEIIINITT